MLTDINRQIDAHERALTILERIKTRVRHVQGEVEHLNSMEAFGMGYPQYVDPIKARIKRIKRVALPMLYEAYQQQLKTISQ